MATVINATTTQGIGITADNTGSLQLQANNTVVANFDSSSNAASNYLIAGTIQSKSPNTAPVFADSSSTPIGTLCRAWVQFNGNGSTSINQQFNVSSVSYISTGTYEVNFANAMPDANYIVALLTNDTSTGTTWSRITMNSITTTPVRYSTTGFRFNYSSAGGSNYQSAFCGCVVFR